MTRLVRAADTVVGAMLVLGLVALWFRAWVNTSDLFDSETTTHVAFAGSVVFGIAFAALSARVSSRVVPLLRPIVYAWTLVIALAVINRLRAGPFTMPPIPTEPGAPEDYFTRMSGEQRALWAARVAQHAHGLDSGSALRVPADWPFPSDIKLTLMTEGGAAAVAAEVPGASRVCIGLLGPAIPLHSMNDGPMCREVGSDKLTFVRPERPAMTVSAMNPGPRAAPWGQYRRDEVMSAATQDSGTSAGVWVAGLLAGARASASVVGQTVLIGTHGGGSLEAFSSRDGSPSWRVILPNWVHQDAVSDGRIVVAGFGDNRDFFRSPSPAGVAAFDGGTGRSLWTRFENSAVMTSPVIWKDQVAYVTTTGVLRLRNIETGNLNWTVKLSGSNRMGPSAVRNDTMVVTLDNGTLCSVSLDQRKTLWCVEFPGMLWLGHSSPSLAGDTIVLSGGAAPSFSNLFRNVGRLPASTSLRWLVAFLGGEGRVRFESQRVLAVRLSDGALLWRSADYYRTRPPEGHISGAATIGDSVIAVNLPVPNVLLVIDRKSLQTLWTASGIGSRGPVLLSRGSIYLATRDGELRVYEAITGNLKCSISVPRTFDRAGPAAGHRSLYFASTEGDLAAVPIAQLDECRKDVIRTLFGSRPVPHATKRTETH